jgi:hypothetical protein
MLVLEHEVLGSIVFDLMVDPRFRQKGIGGDLLLTTWNDVQRLNVSLSFGYANAASRSAAACAGAPVLGPLTQFFLPTTLTGHFLLAVLGLGKRKIKQLATTTKFLATAKHVPEVHVEPFEPTLDNLKSLSLRNSSLGAIQIIRTAPWIHWHHMKGPGRSPRFLVARVDGKMVGYIVYSIKPHFRMSVGEIQDLAFDRSVGGVVGHQLLHTLISSLANVDLWSSLATSGSLFERQLEVAGFSHGIEGPTVSVRISSELDQQVLSRPSLWHLTPSDVF